MIIAQLELEDVLKDRKPPKVLKVNDAEEILARGIVHGSSVPSTTPTSSRGFNSNSPGRGPGGYGRNFGRDWRGSTGLSNDNNSSVATMNLVVYNPQNGADDHGCRMVIVPLPAGAKLVDLVKSCKFKAIGQIYRMQLCDTIPLCEYMSAMIVLVSERAFTSEELLAISLVKGVPAYRVQSKTTPIPDDPKSLPYKLEECLKSIKMEPTDMLNLIAKGATRTVEITGWPREWNFEHNPSFSVYEVLSLLYVDDHRVNMDGTRPITKLTFAALENLLVKCDIYSWYNQKDGTVSRLRVQFSNIQDAFGLYCRAQSKHCRLSHRITGVDFAAENTMTAEQYETWKRDKWPPVVLSMHCNMITGGSFYRVEDFTGMRLNNAHTYVKPYEEDGQLPASPPPSPFAEVPKTPVSADEGIARHGWATPSPTQTAEDATDYIANTPLHRVSAGSHIPVRLLGPPLPPPTFLNTGMGPGLEGVRMYAARNPSPLRKEVPLSPMTTTVIQNIPLYQRVPVRYIGLNAMAQEFEPIARRGRASVTDASPFDNEPEVEAPRAAGIFEGGSAIVRVDGQAVIEAPLVTVPTMGLYKSATGTSWADEEEDEDWDKFK